MIETTLTLEELFDRNICFAHGGKRHAICDLCRRMDALQPTLPGFSAEELESSWN